MHEMPQRMRLYHDVPSWVKTASLYFITINLDQRGSNALVHAEAPQLLLVSARHYHDTGVWWLRRLMLLMPDHLHALLALPADGQLGRVISSWKSYQAKHLGLIWQSGFFDHRLRNEESADEKAHYIRMNPVRAGLVARPEDWPFAWSPRW